MDFSFERLTNGNVKVIVDTEISYLPGNSIPDPRNDGSILITPPFGKTLLIPAGSAITIGGVLQAPSGTLREKAEANSEVLATETFFKSASGGLPEDTTLDDIPEGTTNKAFTAKEKDKLAVIVSVKDYNAVGDNSTDNTAAFKAAVESGASQIEIPDGTYIIDAGHNNANKSIWLKNNQHIVLSQNAVVKVKANNLDSYELFRMDGVSNASISGGTLMGDRSTHTGVTGEYGMLIGIYNSSDITIKDMLLKDAWGDGIYVGADNTGEENINVTIDNVRVDNCRRNNLSIIAVKGMAISNSYFTNANGTNPQAGIDVEPNVGFTAEDINMNNVFAYGNTGPGIVSTGKNVTGNNLTLHDNGDSGLVVNNEENHTFSNVKSYDNSVDGVNLNFGGNTNLSNITAYGNIANGIGSEHVKDNVNISNAKTYDNGESGIYLEGSSNKWINIDNSISYGNTQYGYNLAVPYAKVRGCDAYTNTKSGIFAIGHSHIDNNTIYNNGEHGIRMYGSTLSRIVNNYCHSKSTSSNAGFDNIVMDGSSTNNMVSANTCRTGVNTNKPRYGINVLSGSTGNSIVKNDIAGGGNTGDYNDAASGTYLEPLVTDASEQPWVSAWQFMGSAIKGATIGADYNTATQSQLLVDGRVFFVPVWINKTKTLTGLAFEVAVAPAGATLDQSQQIGLYSMGAGSSTITLVASCANDAALWNTTGLKKKDFSATVVVQRGVYYAAFLYNQSAGTAPSLLGTASAAARNEGQDFTNSHAMTFYKGTSANSLPSTYDVSTSTQHSTTFLAWVY